MNCVCEEYEDKTRIVEEQWLQLKMNLFWFITWKLFLVGGDKPLVEVIKIWSSVYCGGGGGGGFAEVRWSNFLNILFRNIFQWTYKDLISYIYIYIIYMYIMYVYICQYIYSIIPRKIPKHIFLLLNQYGCPPFL